MNIKKYQEQYLISKYENIKSNKEFKKAFVDLIKLLDYIKENNFKIALFGYGTIGEFIYKRIKNNISIIVDSDKNLINNQDIFHPEDLKNSEFDFILVSSLGYEANIEKYLIEKLHIDNEKLLFIIVYENYKYKMWWEQTKSLEKLLINDISLYINPFDKFGLNYDSKSSYDFINNKIYLDINRLFSPSCVIDIGANYGFSTCVFNEFFNSPEFVLIEANKFLIPYLEKNLEINNIKNFKIYNAICSDNDLSETFFLNPKGSHDSRVVADDLSWGRLDLHSISLSEIFKIHPSNFYFIKTDTQGFERKVLMGGIDYLLKNNNWIIQMEFDPSLLLKNGVYAVDFLKELIEYFNIMELPSKTFYKFEKLEYLDFTKNCIKNNELEDFLDYISKLNKKPIGWCDLLISPKKLNTKK